MKKCTSICLILALVLLVMLPVQIIQAANPTPNVVPSLREWTGGTGNFTIGTGSRICVDSSYTTQLTDAANAFRDDMGLITGLTLAVVNTSSPAIGDFYLTLNCSDSGIGNEGYLFEVGSYATIRANAVNGVVFGTKTAMQVLKQDSAKKNIPQGTARDYPKYKERALMIDVARKFFPLDYLKEYIKQLSWFKMNDLHIHLSDNWGSYQAFRVECSTYPNLTATDGSYTKADMRALQDLAKKYGVAITPEFDSPGHALPFTTIRPDIASAQYGNVYLDLNNANTYTFMNSIFDEFVPLFDAPDFHIGTDEYAGDPGDVFRQYINRYDNYLKAKGKKTRIWTGYDHSSGTTQPNSDIIIDDWEGYIDVASLSQQGHDVINSSGDFLYIVPGTSWLPNTKNLYESWAPHIFNSGSTHVLSSTDPHLMGAKLHDWNDNNANGKTHQDIDNLIEPNLKVLAEQVWGGPKSVTYDAFKLRTRAVGSAPGLTYVGLAPVPDGNVAYSKPVTASSIETVNFPANLAVDEDMGTRWSSALSDPQWIYVDLGQTYSVNRAVLKWEAAYGKAYKIQVSNDATNWTDVYSTTTGDGGTDDLSFTATNGRYVRMYGTQRGTTWGYSLYEFAVYGTPVGPTPTPSPTPTPAPGVAYWKFDEGAGTTAADSWGTNSGTLNGATWTTGKYGKALSFNGTSNYVNIGKTDIATPWTAAMWVNRTDSTATSSALLSSSAAALKLEQYNNTNKVGFTKYGTADYVFNYTAPTGVWVHLTFVGTSSGVSLYVNGVFQETNSAVISCPMSKIGSGNNLDYLKGTLDEVKIYNRALSASEIAALAQ